MTKVRTFRDLEVWKKAFELAVQVIRLSEELRKRLPVRMILEQLLRASTSISANIAEGYGSFSKKEFRRYLKIALKSSYETDSWLRLLGEAVPAGREKRGSQISRLQNLNTEITKMLLVLHRKVGESAK
ncbi:MAG: four helix bundle protein [candidate division Zixibacteria bacterium]|nr:four helix bundle protein [candidate division Zixibacteria bacterium]